MDDDDRDRLAAPASLVPARRDLGRRTLLELVGASLALGGASACARGPLESMRPYVSDPPEARPGRPLHYATSMSLDGHATGLVVEAHDGRPTKIEGNPDHPASLGATGAQEQAAILGLYDPARARAARRRADPIAGRDVLADLARPRADQGRGLRVVMARTSSPLHARLVARVLERHPRARLVFHAAVATGATEAGAALAYGRPLQPLPDLGAADVILAIDADPLGAMPMSLAHARRFADRRRVEGATSPMSRLYVVEPMPTPTGMIADHRVRRRACDALGTLAAIVAAILAAGPGGAPMPADLAAVLAPLAAREDQRLAGAIARDLVRAGPAALVVVGDRQPPEAHALAHLAHAALGARTTRLLAPTPIDAGDATATLAALAEDLAAGAVDTLVVLEENVAYHAPADLDLARLVGSAARTVYLGAYEDETARLAHTFLPAAHFLEAWGDALAYDGTYSLAQPLIAPLHHGYAAAEVLAALGGEPAPDLRALVRESFRARTGGDDAALESALRRGLVPGGSPEVAARLAPAAVVAALARRAAAPPPDPAAIEVAFAPDPAVLDGRFANNAWLQELPRPLTKLTWGNAAHVSPATAASLGVASGRRVEIELAGRRVIAPVLVVGGHADRSITLHLGHGRDGAEVIARGVGFDAGRLRTTAARGFAVGAVVRDTGDDEALATTRGEASQEGREVAVALDREALAAQPDLLAHRRGPLPSLFPAREVAGAAWAMTIDLGACTGCSACVVACQAENNVLVVGKEEVLRGRVMHWLRIDTYEGAAGSAAEIVNQPMACQHCEKAPCEYVCPVAATTHSPDGLNEMVYNRCVGTRFCSNNCPYKVRRFNYFDWLDREPANQGTVKLQRNPDVTVRERGVMEKCTYCVQRIREAEIGARVADRPLRDGDVRTACQEACPTRAISFGSITHEGAEVARWRERPHAYAVLHELGTVPRTRYLARVRNPNPEIG